MTALAPAPEALIPESPIPEPEDARHVGLRPAILFGALVIALFFGGFLGWAAVAPLDSAAIAPGVLTVDTRRKTVQHLEGGIISEILVREGDTVTADQVLFRLDDVQIRARLDQLTDAYNAMAALSARLTAESHGDAAVTFPGNLLSLADSTRIAPVLDRQLDVFAAGQAAHRGQIAILNQQIDQSHQEITGLRGQITAQDRQLTLLAEEVADTTKLLNKGLIPKPRVLALLRREAEIAGTRDANRAAIARLGKAIGESEIRIAELQTTRVNDAVGQLQDVDNRLRELAEQIHATQDTHRRTIIRAPIAGTVVGLRVHTTGGVIAPAEPLLDIVPTNERLLIDARINPNDIDVVAPGLTTQVHLTALQQRNMQPLEGTLISVSADSLTDDQTRQRYYLGRVELQVGGTVDISSEDLHAGMQAQVFIITGTRTLLEYAIAPVTRAIGHGLKEE